MNFLCGSALAAAEQHGLQALLVVLHPPRAHYSRPISHIPAPMAKAMQLLLLSHFLSLYCCSKKRRNNYSDACSRSKPDRTESMPQNENSPLQSSRWWQSSIDWPRVALLLPLLLPPPEEQSVPLPMLCSQSMLHLGVTRTKNAHSTVIQAPPKRATTQELSSPSTVKLSGEPVEHAT